MLAYRRTNHVTVCTSRGFAAKWALAGLILLFLVVYRNRLQIFRFEDLTTVQTLDVIDPISPGEDYGTGMLTYALHNQYGKYSTGGGNPVKCQYGGR